MIDFQALRNKILDKAIRGELVPQLETEPAVETFTEEPASVPFAVPEKWKWVQLANIGSIVGGGTPKTSNPEYWNGDVNWLTPADLGKNKWLFIASGAKSITKKGLAESSAKLMPAGSVIYSSRAPIGHIAIACAPVCTNQGCKSFVPNKMITSKWAYYCLIARTPDIQSRASGTTFKEISGKGVGETWIPLAPLEEQGRIVEKVELLLAEVDQAEKAYHELSGPLANRFRSLLLDKAVRGELVPQLETEPAVERFADEPEDVPFAIPEKWKWAKLSLISDVIAGQSPEGISVSESATGLEFHQGKSFFTNDWLAPSNKYTISPSKIAPANSILMSVRAPVGDVNITNRKICIGRGLFGIVPRSNVELKYLYMVLKTKKRELESQATGTTFKAITGKVVKDILIPIPPIDEQRRIVQKLESLLSRVNELTNA